ncbi:FAD-dependent monooxygenase, partial [bacterium]|nr:FAD-dependent monooxygenase [bacterium]
MTDVPVIVVGAGPAGSVAPRELARRGTGVLLVDQATFPRAKVCGCCLNVAGVGALEAVGLGYVLRDLGAVPLRRVRLAAGRADAEVALPGGVAVSRDALDLALLRAAEAAGAAVTTGVRARVEEDGGLRVRLADAVVTPNVVVLASGLPTRADATPGSRLGAGVVLPAGAAPAFFAAGTIYMATARGGYVGL